MKFYEKFTEEEITTFVNYYVKHDEEQDWETARVVHAKIKLMWGTMTTADGKEYMRWIKNRGCGCGYDSGWC